MNSGAVSIRIQKLLLLVTLLVTLGMAPNVMLDPINLPKLLLLTLFSLTLIAILISFGHYRTIYLSHKHAFLGSILFLLSMTISLFANKPTWHQFFGDYGRNTGFLAYACLVVIFVSASLIGSKDFGYKLLASLMLATVINVAYGLLQFIGRDPFDWANPYNVIVGTLGNPNFVSALYGIGATAALAFIVQVPRFGSKFLLATLIVTSLYLAYKSDSIQGLFVAAAGFTVVVYLRFIRRLSNLMKVLYTGLVGAMGLLVTLGTLQIGPLAQSLYQDSITYRGDYWRAGWNMTLENPVAGVGLDNYGDYYRATRSLEATLRRGPEVTSNSAHNVFLDLSSFGGFPLLVSYLVIISLGVRSALRVLQTSRGYEPVIAGLVATWFGYLAQSAISINQLGLAIWGWVIPGAIIGYQINSEQSKEESTTNRFPSVLPAKVIVFSYLGAVLGLLIMIIPVQTDNQFLKALNQRNANDLIRITEKWPQTDFYIESTSRIFLENNLNKESLNLARLSVEKNPRNFRAWDLILKNPDSSALEKALALEKMQELDPNNRSLFQD